LTGHTGFKGAWLNLWLRSLGAKVTGYALAAHTEPSMFALLGGGFESHIADIRDADRVRGALLAADPQIVIHLAAQALCANRIAIRSQPTRPTCWVRAPCCKPVAL
jgi:CDP-glucose 4,6-dehydratase